MQLEQLLQIVLDPNLGRGWPHEAGPVPSWPVGARWRVEYVFTSPALPSSALALGNEVRAVWRYEVLEHGEQEDGTPTVTVRASPERAAEAGYHVLATYDRRDLRLLDAKRFDGERELPLERLALPPLDEDIETTGARATEEPPVEQTDDAAVTAVIRRFRMPEPPPMPELEELEASVDLEALLGSVREHEQEV